MIVRLVLTETEATPDRDLLARLALRHRMRVAGSEERMALRVDAPLDRTLGGATG